MLEKTLESPLDRKEINLEYSLEGLMLKVAILWPSDAKSQLIRKDLNSGKD